MSVTNAAVLYSDLGQAGIAHPLSLSSSLRYHAINHDELFSLALLLNIGSVKLYGAEGGSDLLVFWGPDYQSHFIYFWNWTLDNWDAEDFNHTGADNFGVSVLFVKREPRGLSSGESEIVRFRNVLAAANIEQQLWDACARIEESDAVESAQLLEESGSVFGIDWVFSPEGHAYLQHGRTYLKVSTTFQIEPDFLIAGTNRLEVDFYFYFYLDRGRVEAQIAYCEAHVTDGMWKDLVQLAAEAQLGLVALSINQSLEGIGNTILFNMGTWRELYFVPGGAASEGHEHDGPNFSYTESAADEVNLILVRR